MDDVVTFRVAIKVKVLLTSVYCVLSKYLGCVLWALYFVISQYFSFTVLSMAVVGTVHLTAR